MRLVFSPEFCAVGVVMNDIQPGSARDFYLEMWPDIRPLEEADEDPTPEFEEFEQ